jgi:hypothetical protein
MYCVIRKKKRKLGRLVASQAGHVSVKNFDHTIGSLRCIFYLSFVRLCIPGVAVLDSSRRLDHVLTRKISYPMSPSRRPSSPTVPLPSLRSSAARARPSAGELAPPPQELARPPDGGADTVTHGVVALSHLRG